MSSLLNWLFKSQDEPVLRPKGAVAFVIVFFSAVLFGVNAGKLGVTQENFWFVVIPIAVIGLLIVLYFNRK